MKLYKGILAAVIVLAIGFGIWYCVSAYYHRSSNDRGLLVQQWEVETCEGNNLC